MKLWVDPPEGWRYGFPKVWDSMKYPNLYMWLAQEGYPSEVRNSYGTHFLVRQWPVMEDDK
jgi:hypothetical protein